MKFKRFSWPTVAELVNHKEKSIRLSSLKKNPKILSSIRSEMEWIIFNYMSEGLFLPLRESKIIHSILNRIDDRLL